MGICSETAESGESGPCQISARETAMTTNVLHLVNWTAVWR